MLCRALMFVDDQWPRLRLERDLASLPGSLAHVGGGFVERELVRPGREAAVATEVAQLAQDRDERVVRALLGQIVVVTAPQVRRASASAVHFKPRCSK